MKEKTKFKVGDRVEVYSLMNPLRDFKGHATVVDVGPMYAGGEDMLWLNGEAGVRVRGAWSSEACSMAREPIGEIKK